MISKIKLLMFATMMLISINTFSQDIKQVKVKTLIIIENEQKLWTQQEMQDSINWPKVKSINILSDSIARIKKYGEKAKYGAIIVKYNNSAVKIDEGEDKKRNNNLHKK